jgi:hypothetical protein
MPMLARSAPALLPDDVRASLSAAEGKLAALLNRQRELAEQSLVSPAAEQKYQDIVREIAAADGEIKRYEAALENLEAKAKEARTREQIAEQAALRQRVLKILDGRLPAAKRFEAAIAEAVLAFRELFTASDRAHIAWPGTPPNGGAALGNLELLQLIRGELFRQGHVVLVTGRTPSGGRQVPSLPAPKSPGFEFADMPERIQPLAAAIEAANAFARAVMEGKHNG